VRILLDQNISPLLKTLLGAAGHRVEHVTYRGMSDASDATVLAAARDADAVLITSDTDFGEILARSNAAGPSVILLRRQDGRRASEIASLIVANLDAVTKDLAVGALVVFDADRVRVRNLPFRPES